MDEVEHELRMVIDPILQETPEHNRKDEHEKLLNDLVTAIIAKGYRRIYE